MANQQRNKDVKNRIKDAAGAAFHGAHRALETTEDAAMNAVDATANAINNLRNNEDNNQSKGSNK